MTSGETEESPTSSSSSTRAGPSTGQKPRHRASRERAGSRGEVRVEIGVLDRLRQVHRRQPVLGLEPGERPVDVAKAPAVGGQRQGDRGGRRPCPQHPPCPPDADAGTPPPPPPVAG